MIAAPEAYFAGGVAPDAIRLFAGADKVGSHFYDDRDPSTWGVTTIVDAFLKRGFGDALPDRSDAALAWCIGYLAHVLADVANWTHLQSRLPAFPAERAAHHGIWLIADRLPVDDIDRTIELARVPYAVAPPWIDHAAVERLLSAVVNRVLTQADPWLAEATYVRHDRDLMQAEPLDLRALGVPDSTLVAVRDRHLPEWEASVARARLLVPDEAWSRFETSAIEGSIEAIRELGRRLGI